MSRKRRLLAQAMDEFPYYSRYSLGTSHYLSPGWGGGGGFRGDQPQLIGTKGGPGKKGENYLKGWDQFITFLMMF